MQNKLRLVVLLALLMVTVFLTPGRKAEALGFCDNSNPCVSVCTIVTSEGQVRRYFILHPC
jgi:hypothetical protein